MPLLAIRQLHGQLFKAGLGGRSTLLQLIQRGLYLGHIGLNLRRAGTGLLGLLCQAQHVHLQFVGGLLGLGGFTPGGHQTLCRIGIGGFCPHQGSARLFADQGLSTQFFVQMFNFLGARQQARLLGILRIKTHAVRRHRMAGGYVDGFTGL